MFRQQSRRPVGYRKYVSDTSPVRTATGRAQADDSPESKPARQSRGENTGDRPGRMSASSGHSSGLVARRAGFPPLPPYGAAIPPSPEGDGPLAGFLWSSFRATCGALVLVTSVVFAGTGSAA